MACRELGGSKILLYLGIFLVVSTFCHCSKLIHNSTLNQSRDKSNVVHTGRLLFSQQVIGHKSDNLDVDSDYQADMGWEMSKQPSGPEDGFSKPDQAIVEQLLQMDPKVECTADSMKLQVREISSTPGTLLLVDRGTLMTPLPLSMLPQSCGYTIRSTPSNMVLVAPYNGCFVTVQEDAYVLPLLWWGLPVRMTCPLMRRPSNAPVVTCHAEGMVVKLEWTLPASKMKINLNGDWEWLSAAALKCGITVGEHVEGVSIFVRYDPCVEMKDGKYTVLLAGEREVKVSCPTIQGQSGPTRQTTQAPKKEQSPDKEWYPHHTVDHSYKPTVPPNPMPFTHQVQPKPDINPTPAPQPPKPPKPEVLSGRNRESHYLYPYPPYPMPSPGAESEEKPTPAPKPEVPSDHDEKPYYPFTMPWPEKKPNKVTEPLPSPQPPKPQPPEVFPGDIHQHYTYPLYPVPNPGEDPDKKPMPAPPKQLEDYPGHVKPFYPFFTMPWPENKPNHPQPPKTQPDLLPGLTQKPAFPFPYPFYTMPTPVEDKIPMPSLSKPELLPLPPKPPRREIFLGPIQNPDDPYKYPLYPMPDPLAEPDKKPMPVPPKQPEDYPDHVKPFYPFVNMPWPEKEPNQHTKPVPPLQPLKPQQPGVQSGLGGQPAFDNLFNPPLDDKPVVPLLPQNPVTQTSQTGQPVCPKNYPFCTAPEEKPILNKPQEPVIPPIDSLWPVNPIPGPEFIPVRHPECPPGHVQCKHPFQVYVANGPPKKPVPPEPKQPPCKEQQPAHPYPNPLYPWLFQPPQPEVPPSQAEKPVYPFLSIPVPEKKPLTEPAQPPQLPKPQEPELPPGQLQPPHYPYLYPPYSVPTPDEMFKKPPPSLQPTEPESEHPPVDVEPAKPFPSFPFNPVPVIKPTHPPQKPEVPEKTVQGPQPPPIPDVETNARIHSIEKPKNEKPPAKTPPDSQMPQWRHPQWQQFVALPSASPTKQPQHGVKTPLQALLSQGSTRGCIKFCTAGFSNCCPQIAFHQHLYHLPPPVPDGKVTSQGFPYVASMTYGPGNGIHYTWSAQKPHDSGKAADSVPTSTHFLTYGSQKQQPDQPLGDNLALPGHNPTNTAASEVPIYPFVPNSNSRLSSWPYETIQHSPQGQSSPEDVPPFSLENLFNAAVNQGGQNPNRHPTKQNVQLSSGLINYSPGLNAMSHINQYLQQQQTNQMPTPLELFHGPEKPSPPEAEGELSHLLPYSMFDDFDATTNTSVLTDLPRSSLPKKTRKFFKRGQARRSYEPKGYMLLQHGPPGKEAGTSESKQKFPDEAIEETVPARRLARKSQHLRWLEPGVAKTPKDDFKSSRPDTELPNVPVNRRGLDHPSEEGSE
uniref:trithorax group protein osa-like n=1 Tax=Doryrhamphus excisus TaxID=161450 RepID=UPI0025AE91B2|nr:trithorax group protein osa-like [Doryrhamphus excisus]